MPEPQVEATRRVFLRDWEELLALVSDMAIITTDGKSPIDSLKSWALKILEELKLFVISDNQKPIKELLELAKVGHCLSVEEVSQLPTGKINDKDEKIIVEIINLKGVTPDVWHNMIWLWGFRPATFRETLNLLAIYHSIDFDSPVLIIPPELDPKDPARGLVIAFEKGVCHSCSRSLIRNTNNTWPDNWLVPVVYENERYKF